VGQRTWWPILRECGGRSTGRREGGWTGGQVEVAEDGYDRVQRYPGLEVRVRSAPPDSLAAAAVLRALRAAGAAPVAVEPLNESGTIEVRVRRPPR
jgi:hypothetical protein